jgi:hypothetical protein
MAGFGASAPAPAFGAAAAPPHLEAFSCQLSEAFWALAAARRSFLAGLL